MPAPLVHLAEQIAEKFAGDERFLAQLSSLLEAISRGDRFESAKRAIGVGTFLIEPEDLTKPIGDTSGGTATGGSGSAASSPVARAVTQCPKCKAKLTITHP
ncbi:hypothetical protein Psta_4028 [Pirellula staleyi DSM 6068]|uniref:Uncharacterized protein n=1 Tax=Pirellula staleyi (strain ATCC 27377 / DSM 6068 / ICPB 4128) TaxID=530564 RepID=D2R270_PIRSD|nr:hypothetical protein [Pirellula staleyi]ADB18681.1 hypothetical protein Psta_4028 [Pirellula staleyi DSM 6068]